MVSSTSAWSESQDEANMNSDDQTLAFEVACYSCTQHRHLLIRGPGATQKQETWCGHQSHTLSITQFLHHPFPLVQMAVKWRMVAIPSRLSLGSWVNCRPRSWNNGAQTPSYFRKIIKVLISKYILLEAKSLSWVKTARRCAACVVEIHTILHTYFLVCFPKLVSRTHRTKRLICSRTVKEPFQLEIQST